MKKTIGDPGLPGLSMRLSVKYLVFDLEATRRENQYLRKLIERHNGRNEPSSEE